MITFITSFIVALTLAGLTSVWRFYDGSPKDEFRQRTVFHWLFLQTSTPAVLCLIAGLWSAWPLPSFAALGSSLDHSSAILLPIMTAAWLMIRGMPGWTEWKPMLLGFALPTFLAGLLYGIVSQTWPYSLFWYSCSGLIVALTYVGLSRLELDGRCQSLFRFLTAEKYGRLSYGFIVFGLALL
jgi:hypothetical protein